MTTYFPYGATQTLILGSETLTIDECDFNTDGSAGLLGYIRTRTTDQLAQAEYTLYGSPALKGLFSESKHDFRWSLSLPIAKAYQLHGMFMRQQLLARQSGALAIRLNDTRLAYIEPTVRTRAKVGALITSPTPPANYVQFWPRFSILMSEPIITLNLPRLGFAFAEFGARELEFLGTSEDA